MAKVGDYFKIGEICPISGVYRLRNCECDVSRQQEEIPLTKGKRFPPCKNCTKKVLWELIEIT